MGWVEPCETCLFYSPNPGDHGECRKRAPHPTCHADNPLAHWPEVSCDDGCGEHEMNLVLLPPFEPVRNEQADPSLALVAQETASPPRLVRVEITICEACLKGEGEKCHTPGCAMWLHKVDLAIHPKLFKVLSVKGGGG